MGRQWSRAEDVVLYERCGTASIRVVAKEIGRSPQAVDRRLHQLGIVWRQGRYGVRDIARAAGCGITAARRAINILIHDPPTYSAGGGMRYAITVEDRDRVVSVLKRTQTAPVVSLRRSEAGRKRRRKKHCVRCIVCGRSFWCVTGRASMCGAACRRKRNTELTRRRRYAG